MSQVTCRNSDNIREEVLFLLYFDEASQSKDPLRFYSRQDKANSLGNSLKKVNIICVFCNHTSIQSLEIGTSKYHHCMWCGGFFLDPKCYVSIIDEKKRYEFHNNSLENKGYKEYLEKFIDSVMQSISKFAQKEESIHRVFDYGSGPEPSLAILLRQKGYQVSHSDPFFSPQSTLFSQGADLVTCLEVAEHFKNPKSDFKMIASLVHPGGFVAIGTHVVDSVIESDSAWDSFGAWWYRQDITHVSFYSELALQKIAKYAGFEWLGPCATHVFLLKKR